MRAWNHCNGTARGNLQNFLWTWGLASSTRVYSAPHWLCTQKGKHSGAKCFPSPKEKTYYLTTDEQLPWDILRTITAHILPFPTVESHYCRSSSSKQYLHPSLNIPKMYPVCSHRNVGQDKLSFVTYSRIFKKMNLSFHKPKKDLCSLCLTYRSGDEKSKDNLNKCFHSHITKKTKVREFKEASKQRVK